MRVSSNNDFRMTTFGRWRRMLMVEIVANTLLVLVALVGGGLMLNRAMKVLVERNFAKIARVESRDLDEQLRYLSE